MSFTVSHDELLDLIDVVELINDNFSYDFKEVGGKLKQALSLAPYDVRRACPEKAMMAELGRTALMLALDTDARRKGLCKESALIRRDSLTSPTALCNIFVDYYLKACISKEGWTEGFLDISPEEAITTVLAIFGAIYLDSGSCMKTMADAPNRQEMNIVARS